MKIIPQHKEGLPGGDDLHWKAAASQLEKDGDNPAALFIYEDQLKKHPLNAYIYDRLMILYRKEKKYKKEMALLKTAIEKFTALVQPSGKGQTKKIASLSRSILLSTGLTNKKGAPLYHPQPIARWEKRKQILQKKMNVGRTDR